MDAGVNWIDSDWLYFQLKFQIPNFLVRTRTLKILSSILKGSAFMLERTRKHDLEGNGLPNKA